MEILSKQNKHITLRLASVLLIFILFSVQSFAQERGSVSGIVRDSDTEITLPGATVVVAGTTHGVTTDIHGNFVITNLPAGSTVLKVSFLGYAPEEITVEVIQGETRQININLSSGAMTLQEFTFSSQALGQARAISQQLGSDAMVNIVSEERLRELPDVNAAEALGRLPGVALQRSAGEGQKVLIRGMDPTFSAITINGVRVPSNDPTDRSVNLTMISSESLAGIELYKSPTPDMDGEAVGGTVNLRLKRAPEEQAFDLRLGGGYNQLRKDPANYNISGTYSNRIFNQKLGIILQANAESVNRGSENFGGNYSFGETIIPNRFTLNDRLETRQRLGGSVIMDYDLPRGDITLYSYYGATTRDEERREQVYDPYDYNTIRFGHTKNEVELDLFSNMLSGQHDFRLFKIDWSASYAHTGNHTPYNTEIWFWDNGAYAHNPDIGRNMERWADSARVDYTRAGLREAEINKSEFFENNYSAAINIDVPFQLGNNVLANFKSGAKYRALDRDFETSRLAEEFYYLGGNEMQTAVDHHPYPLYMTPGGLIAMTNLVGGKPYHIGTFLDGSYHMENPMNQSLAKDWFIYQADILHEDRNALAESYDLTESVLAGYGMLRMNFFDQVTMITGVRIEQSDNTYNAIASTLSGRYGIQGKLRDTTTTQKYTDILPHLHLRYEPLDWFDVRLSYAKTLARPSFNMIIPRSSVNFMNARITSGNPDLKHMEAKNYDLTLSFYDGNYGLLAISGFYKDLKNIFFRVENATLVSDSLAESYGFPGRKDYMLNTFDNSPEASVYGIEVDLQTNMNFLPEPFNGLVLNANITYQFSETYKYTYITTDTVYRVNGHIITESFLEEVRREIPMPGQAPLILNLALGYDLGGFSGRVSANHQDNYLIFPGSNELQDNINWSFWRFDIALKQKINENLSLFLNLNNITNMQEESYRNYNTSFPSSIRNYGAVYTFGLQLKI